MGYISIEKFIDYVSKNKPPRTYWCSGFHKNYLRTINLDEYVKWLHYLIGKKRAYCKAYKKTEIYKEIAHEYYLRNKELYIERAKKWYCEHRRKATGEIRAYIKGGNGKDYYKTNKEKVDLYHKNYVKKNKKKINEYMRNYMKKYSANLSEEKKQKRREYQKEYQLKRKGELWQTLISSLLVVV